MAAKNYGSSVSKLILIDGKEKTIIIIVIHTTAWLKKKANGHERRANFSHKCFSMNVESHFCVRCPVNNRHKHERHTALQKIIAVILIREQQ